MWRIAWAFVLGVCAAAAERPAVRVLLVSGGGAEERAAAALLADALRQAGSFAVFTSDDPGALTTAAVARYDVLAVDCDGAWWGDAAQRAVERFVARGKGLAVVRAGDCALGPEPGRRRFAALAGAAAAAGAASGSQPLRVTATPPFLTVDDPGPALTPVPGTKILAAFRPEGRAGVEQPAAWTTSYGKGRVFVTRLGRNQAVRGEREFVDTFLGGVAWAAQVAPQPRGETVPPVRTLVVTGGHNYDPTFYTLFEGRPGITASIDPHPMPYRRGDLRKNYDVLVLYDSMQQASEPERVKLTNFLESGKGLVILHHALVDYSDWPWWYEQVMGGRWLKVDGPVFKWKTAYKHDVDMLVYPVGEHPVTAGVGPMRIQDETYKGMWLSPENKVLMRTDDPSSDGPVVWISPYPKSRVVVIELGHDRKAHLHPGYQKLVRNAILWSAGKE